MECTTDCLLATGVPLNDPTCLDETKWISPGILGQKLEGIQTEQSLCLNSAHTYQQQGAIHSNIVLPPQTNTVTSLPLSDPLVAIPLHGAMPSASHTFLFTAQSAQWEQRFCVGTTMW